MTSTEDKLRDYLKLVTGDLRQTRERLRAVEASRSEPIAIVGMACRYAGGADTPERLWELLAAGTDTVAEPPAARGWDLDAIYDPDPDRPGTTYAREGAFLDEAAAFDPEFFGMSPREALATDPQQRLLLEVSWEAIERAGIDPRSLRDSSTGTFVGGYDSNYRTLVGSHQQAEGHGITGISPSVLSGRVAYILGLEGPAVTVDTACSSSLVALHMAAKALRAGECELALAGGVTVMATPAPFVEFSRQRGLAPDGRCKAFADSADGMGWAEGVGVLVLERLSHARAAGHRVLAVLRGSAVNSDGASSGLTAPNGPSQQRVIQAALADARLPAAHVDAVEGHGTGTTLGDPIEAQALLATYGQEREDGRPLLLGSVKSNIGHSQAAAGVAGVIKMVMAIREGVLPRTLHVDRPSSHVDWSTGAVELLTDAVAWPQTGRPRRAGVSSFGISGTNAHLIVEQAPDDGGQDAESADEVAPPVPSVLPLTFSGRTPEALRAAASALLARLTSPGGEGPALLDTAYSLATGRSAFEHRAVVLATDPGTTAAALRAAAEGAGHAQLVTGTAAAGATAVLFSGQGAQRLGMGRELYGAFPVFARALDEALGHFDGLRDVMWGTDAALLNRTGWAQPALFAVEVALFRLAESWGLRPDYVGGHSIGEVAAAHVAGVLSLADACVLVAARARLMQALPSGGAMAALQATEDDVTPLLADGVSVAAVNGPRSVVVAGDEGAVTALADGFAARGHRTRRLSVSHAFHSPLMEPMLDEFAAALAGVTFHAPRIPLLSNVTGALAQPREICTPEYWVRHVRETVRFCDGVTTLLREGVRRFAELGPDGVLSAMVMETADALGDDTTGPVSAVPALRADRPEEHAAVAALAAWHTAGATLDGAGFFAGLGASTVDVPTYPFQNADFWPDATAAPQTASDPADDRFWGLVDGDVETFATALDLDGDTAAALVPALAGWREKLRATTTMDSWRYRVEWTPLRLADGAGPTGTWLLVRPEPGAGESADALADAVADALRAAGAGVTCLRADALAAVTGTFGGAGAPAGVVSLLGLDERPLPGHPVVPTGLAATAALVGSLADAGITAPLWVLTSGAVAAGRRDLVTAPQQATVWGLGRVAALEHPTAWGGLVDLPAALDEHTAARLVAVLSGRTGEDQVAVRPWGAYGRRLVHAPVGDARPPARLRPDGTVLITGGLGDLGTHVARWAAAAGAGHLLLLGRRGSDTPGAEELRAELTAAGACVTIAACDVADRDALAAVLDAIPGHAPLSAVVHTAGLISDDGEVASLTGARLARTLDAKVLGARHLHDLTRDMDLDAFVLFSSGAGVWGSGGFGSYAAANAYLDALAEHRAAAGLPATALAWGTWAGRSRGAAFTEVADRFQHHGVLEMDPALAVAVLHRTLQDGRSGLVVSDFDWSRFAPSFTHSRPSPLLSGLPEAREALAAGVADGVGTGALAGLDGADLRRAALDLVRGEVASVLGHADAAAIGAGRPFQDLGFDSLTAVELRNRLTAATGRRLPATLIFDHPTPTALAAHLAAAVSGASAEHGEAAVRPSDTADDPVVIVGMGCRYPGGVASPEDLWHLVADGVEGISAFPDDRGWDLAGLAAGACATDRGGFLSDAADFDAGFFGISPREALAMDPQQRLLLETSWTALESGGIDPAGLRGSRAGVFVGTNGQDYAHVVRGADVDGGHAGAGAAASVMSGRIAYALGLEGPAVTVDTACSSSLVALHLAASSLRDEECTVALAAGVSVMSTPGSFVDFSIPGGLAADGRAKAFAEGADGTVWAEGVGVLVLERLSHARAAGHRVLAVLRGSAVNSDGASNGLTAPNGPSQQRVIRAALAASGLTPADVDTVEAHGTGTTLGDPVEAQALLATYGQERGACGPLLIGSVKSNIGHSQAASGVAGVIKMVEAMAHGVLPRTLHVDRPSTHVDWSAGAVELLTEAVAWPETGRPRRAGVSSFGVSGTNVHLVIEQAPEAGGTTDAPPPAVAPALVPWPASAKSRAALDARLAQLTALADGGAHTLDVGAALAARTPFEHRAVLLATPGSDTAPVEAAHGVATDRTLAVLFSGQGAQRLGMGRELYGRFPVFARAFDEVTAELDARLEGSLRDVVWGGDADELNTTGWAQPALFAIEVALFRLAESLGIRPSYVGGHSIGEVAAAHVAGVLSLADACVLVAARARLMQALPSGGAMAALQATEAEVLPLLTGGVSLAAVNGPEAVVVAGDADAVADIAARLRGQGRRTSRLRVSHAFHSPLMEPMLDEFAAALAGLAFHAPRIPLLSNVTGALAQPREICAPEYWVRHVRETVRFSDGVDTLLGRGVDAVLELGPDGVLAGSVQDCLAVTGRQALVTPLLRRDRPEERAALTALARLFTGGVDVDLGALFEGTGARPVPLPGYPFQRERYWPERPAMATAETADAAHAEFWAAVARGDTEEIAAALGLDDATVSAVVPALAAWRERRRDLAAVESLRHHDRWVPLPPVETAAPRRLLALVPLGAPAAEAAVAALGAVTLTVPAVPERATLAAALREALDVMRYDAVVSLLALGAPAAAAPAEGHAAALTVVLQALGDAGSDAPLWAVTRGALDAGARTDPLQAAVWGVGRVAALEYPRQWGGLADLPADPSDEDLRGLAAALSRGDDENELAVRGSTVLGRRIVPAPPVRGDDGWRPTGTVLVTGGTGALGAHVARWLAGRGAPHLLLVGRRGPDAPGAAKLRAELTAAGAAVTLAACDAADRDGMRAVLDAIPAEHPLTGVVHAAGVLDDGVIEHLTPDRFTAVHRAKVDSALVLDDLTAELGLDVFALFSSASAAIGNLGQAVYAAANAELDALAVRRRALGRAATSIAWGGWAGGGMAAGDAVGEHLAALAPEAALAVLGRVVTEPEPTVTVLDLADRRLLHSRLSRGPAPLLSLLPAARDALAAIRAAGREAGDDGTALAQRLRALPAGERSAVLLGLVRARAAAVLGHATSAAVEVGKAFRDLGFDSLTALELRNQLAELTGLTLPAGLVFDFPTAGSLTEHLLGRLLGDTADEAAPAATATATDEPLAIVAMACRFPGGVTGPEDLWRVLADGTDAISAFPEDRGWDLDALFDGDADGNGRSSTREGGFLTDVAGFDAAFFGISPREALAMDPQQRLLLETSWEGFERAGIDPAALRGSRTGVFVGTNGLDYAAVLADARDGRDGHAATGLATSVIAGRVAYTFGLEGPALTVDTACSASLVALHLAAESLRRGECELALAGGVTVISSSGTFVELSRQGALAPDGRCKTFSDAADGTGFAEGAGMLLLEPLSRARAEGHDVLAVLRGSAVNQDGASNGLTAPSGQAQQRVIRQALANAGLDPADIDAVEAHGTGTRLGDPIEAEALLATYGADRDPAAPLWLGSVKSNIGHTQAAAGAAGVIKMVLAMRHGLLPRTLHVDTLSSHIDWSAGPVSVLTEPVEWRTAGERPRRAGVSAFGISGTNAHLVLEQAPEPAPVPDFALPDDPEDPEGQGAPAPLLAYPLSAASQAALRGQAARLADHLEATAGLEPVDVAHSLTTGRAALDQRAVVVADGLDDLRGALRALADGEQRAGTVTGQAAGGGQDRIAFVFPGQGSQWEGMAVGLLDESPVFAARMAECERALAPCLDWSVTEVLRGADGAPSIERLDVVQPVLFAVMVSLAAVWQSHGVRPDCVIGTSQGEVAAACVAGALSVEDAARVIAERSKVLAARLVGEGALASLALSAEAAAERIARWDGRLSIGGVNGPALVTVAGDDAALADLAAECDAEGIRLRRIAASVPTHCALVDPLRDSLLRAVRGVRPATPEVPVYSTVTGGRLGADELMDEEYWYDNTRRPVLFSRAAELIFEAGCGTFLEMSPHPVMSFAIDGIAAARGERPVVLGSLRRGAGGLARMLTSLGEAHANGVTVDFSPLYGGAAPRRTELPTYAFQHERYWPQPADRPAGGAAGEVDADFWAAVEQGDVDTLATGLELGADVLDGVLPALRTWRGRRRDQSAVESWRYRVAWRPAKVTDRAPAGSWLLVTAEGCQDADVLAAFEARGVTVRRLVLDAACEDRAVLAGRLADASDAAGVVSLLAGAQAPSAGHPRLTAGLALTVSLVQALGDAGIDAPLWFLTRGAVSTGRTDPVLNPAQAQVLGVGWTAALELPHRTGGVLDLPESLDTVAGRALLSVLAGADGEDQLAIRAAGVLTRRVVPAPTTDRAPARPWTARGTALVTGGTGQIGPDLVRWLAEQGAEHIVLTSRGGTATPAVAEVMAEFDGVVTVAACDVADREALAALVARLRAEGHDIRTVVHAAAVIELAHLADTELDHFARIIDAKVNGARNLDELFADDDLDAFVLYSSNAGMWGSGEHGAYVAGNAYLAALAHNRRARGLVATSVHWGKWPDNLGLFGGVEDPFGVRRGGLEYIEPRLALNAMRRLLDDDETAVALTDVNWPRYYEVFTSGRPTTLFDEIPEVRALVREREQAAEAADEAEFTAGLRALPPAEQHRRLLTLVRGEAAAVLGHASADALPEKRAFRDVGFDSVTAVDLRNRLVAVVGTPLPATLVFDYPNPVVLADHLRTQMFGAAAPAADRPLPAAAADDEPIAIISMGCRFPGGVEAPEDLWRLLLEGADVTSGYPADRGWDLESRYDPDRDRQGTTYALNGGFMDDVAGFDAGFFGISPREALAMDPQQRLLLQTAWETVERAGIDMSTLHGSATGTFIGAVYPDYRSIASLKETEDSETHAVTGAASCVLSGRLSYVFGFEGPAVTLDTGCSSSLVALHLACQSLRGGDSTLALAGGVTVMSSPAEFVGFSRLGALAPDGRCKAFAESADGMALSEGVGVVLVERLSDARRNGHPVLAVVRASAMNQDGASNGLTAPNGPSQQRVIRQALATAGLGAADVDVVEAHGTGTKLGDPIEAQALLATYGQDRDGAPLLLGSVKSNIGHTQMASGAASIIKMVEAIGHGYLPRTLHAEQPSSHVDWDAGALKLLDEGTEWPDAGRPRRAGVSSFGISGTNVHVILEQPTDQDPADGERPPAAPPVRLPWLVSSKTAAGLRDQAARLAAHLTAHPGTAPADIGWSLLTGRQTFEHRAVVLGTTADEFERGLRALAGDAAAPGTVSGAVVENSAGPVFVYPGQGSQWWGMGRDLLAASDVFRSKIAECAEALAPHIDWPLLDVVAGLADEDLMSRVDVVQPALFAMMVSLTEVWRSYGVEPAAVLGHSQGEIAAAHVAGALTLQDAAAVVALRSQALVRLCGRGGMVSVADTLDRVRALIEPWGEALSVAAVNGPESTVVSGAATALDALLPHCEQQGVRARRVNVDYASHSAQVEEIQDELAKLLAHVAPRTATVPFYSTVTAARFDTTGLDGAYWYTNLRGTVRLQDTVTALAGDGYRVFVESSPHPVLTGPLGETLEAVGGEFATVGTLRRGDGGVPRMLTSLAEAHVRGVEADWSTVYDGVHARRTALPTYAFQNRRYWWDTDHAPAQDHGEPGADAAFWDLVGTGDADSLAAALDVDAATAERVAPGLASWLERSRARATVDGLRYRVEWTALPDPGGRPLGNWLLVLPEGGADSPWATAVRTALGVQCAAVELPPGDPDRAGVARLVTEAAAGMDTAPEGVLSLLATDERPCAGAPSVPRGLAATTALAQALGDTGLGAPLWAVTTGAVSTGRTDRVTHPVQAAVWGLGRVAALEHPDRWGGLADLPEQPDDRTTARLLARLAEPAEDQVALRPSGALARRLAHAPARPATPPRTFAPTGTVLVTGGTGGVGSEVARWAAAAGAPHLLLTSRRGPEAPGAAELAEELRATGARVTVTACDAADRDAVRELLASVPDDLPLTAVFHAAGIVGGDSELDGLDTAQLGLLLGAKATAAWHLHELTLPGGAPGTGTGDDTGTGDGSGTGGSHGLVDFVLFASGAGVWGSAGQSAYAAANASLDALAQYRADRGLPATSVAWGTWGEAGLVAEGEVNELLRRLGVLPMRSALALDALRGAIEDGDTTLTVSDMDWERFAPSFAVNRPTRLLDALPEVRALAADADDTAGDGVPLLRQRLDALPAAERQGELVALVRAEAGAVLGYDSGDAVPAERAFREFGFDSVTAVELRNRLKAATGLNLPGAVVFDYPNPTALARHLHTGMYQDGAAAPAGDDPDAEVRDLLAAIPVSRLRSAGLLDMVLRLADEEPEQQAPAGGGDAGDLGDLDALDGEDLLRLAGENTQ
ncbi:type I polyketide synthase [Streptomyces sp. NPDC050560]|uniref:type I polyketide synthase n=1 Tax=Streptomyces sp. NPDC050560 TaxID=3365630 RepID=UPI0037AECEA7